MKFVEKLEAVMVENGSLLCVGLDTDTNNSKFPRHLKDRRQPIFEFNKAIVAATADLVCAFKPNEAFYKAQGVSGIDQLVATCEYIHTNHPRISIILDAKNADIGITNEVYARYAFDYLGVDAITLHPYLGREALKPFLERSDKGSIILCRTSNPGAGEFQDLIVDGEPFYKRVARQVVTEWNVNNNCLLVVGATCPGELRGVRQIATEMTFLVPGIGAQGGKVEEVVPAGVNSAGRGMIINSSRGIIFASSGEDFAERARVEAQVTRVSINQYRPQ